MILHGYTSRLDAVGDKGKMEVPKGILVANSSDLHKANIKRQHKTMYKMKHNAFEVAYTQLRLNKWYIFMNDKMLSRMLMLAAGDPNK